MNEELQTSILESLGKYYESGAQGPVLRDAARDIGEGRLTWTEALSFEACQSALVQLSDQWLESELKHGDDSFLERMESASQALSQRLDDCQTNDS